MGGVAVGSPVSAGNTNSAFLEKNDDDTTVGRVTLANALSVSGSQVDNTQRELNSESSYTGNPLNSAKNNLPVWTDTDAGSSTDNLTQRAEALTKKFNPTLDATHGHSHNGSAGQGPQIQSSNIAGTVLQGFFIQGTDLTGVTGTSTNVTTQLTGIPVSTGQTQEGAVTTAPNNTVGLVNSSTGTEFVDGSGRRVYGRLAFAGSTYTLSYYVNIAGVETAYSFSSSPVRWFYQQLFNPIVDGPVYSPLINMPSLDTVADVPAATTSLQGKTLLASAAAQSVGSSNTVGTTNATVANADHTHQGVHSINGGSSNLFGDVVIAGAGGSVASQSSQTVTITSPALSSTTPADVGSAGAIGSGTTSAKSDHVHRGVASFAKTSGTLRYGAISLTPGTNVTITDNTDGSYTIAAGGSGSGASYVTKTHANTPYSITTSDQIIGGDVSGGDLVVTLPTAVGNTNLFTITKVSSTSSNVVTINTTSAQSIGQRSSGDIKFTNINDSITVVSDNTNWQIQSYSLNGTVSNSTTTNSLQSSPSAATWYQPSALTISVDPGYWRFSVYGCGFGSLGTNTAIAEQVLQLGTSATPGTSLIGGLGLIGFHQFNATAGIAFNSYINFLFRTELVNVSSTSTIYINTQYVVESGTPVVSSLGFYCNANTLLYLTAEKVKP